MKVLTLSYDDYANLAFDHTRALQSVGVDAQSMKLKAHAFNYEKQAVLASIEQMLEACADADVIMIYHSAPIIRDIVKNFVSKNKEPRAIIAFHSGSLYRQDPLGVCAAFDELGCAAHLTDQCEFLLTPIYRELTYVAAAIDVPAVRAQGTFPKIGDRYRVAHYPSKADIKGTAELRQMMAPYDKQVDFICSEERVAHRAQLQRMSDCDVYLELFQLQLEGKPYGCHGVTAFEAAALGRVVMTQNIHSDAYEQAYGCKAPFFFCNTVEQFNTHMKWISKATPADIQRIQEATYQWVLTYHGMEATGKRLAGILSEL